MRTSVKRFSKSLTAGVLAGGLAISGLAVAFTASPAAAATTNRIGGANRYDTARLAAIAQFPGGSANAVLATGQNFPDGLASADLAGSLGAPILLTPTAVLAPETVAALASLHVHTVYIVGGPSAVAPAVLTQLQGLGYTVPAATAGADRYATAAAVATASTSFAPIGTIGGKKTAIVATGLNFPDALTAGAASYFAHLPILLTDTNTLSTSTSAAITSLGITNVLIAGGTSAVSAAVETSLKALAGGALTTTRLSGADRFATSVAIATFDTTPVISGGLAMPTSGTGPAGVGVILASGLNFPDAEVAAEFGVPIVLNDPLPASVAAWLTANGAAIANITALGGTAVISAADLAAAGAATTPTSGTATVTASAGNHFFTVAFSAAVNTPVIGNFSRNNVAIAGAGSGVINLGNNTYEVVLPTGVYLQPSDVVGLFNGALPTGLNTTTPVTPATTTVAANAAPTIVSVQFTSNGTTDGPAVSVLFSKSVSAATVATSVKVNGATLGAPAVSATDLTGFTWTAPLAGATGPGGTVAPTDVLTILGGTTGTPAVPAGIADNATPAVPLGATASFNASTNTVKPLPSAAKSAVVSNTEGAVSPAITGAGNALTVSAKAGTAADGANGALFKVAVVAPAGGQTGLVVTPVTTAGVTTFTISWPAAIFTSPAALAAALNASAPLNTLLVANGTGASAVGASTASGPTALAGGSTTSSITVLWSKPVVPNAGAGGQDAVGTYAVSTGVAPSTVLPNGQAPGTVPQVFADTLIYTATTPAGVLVPGTTTVTITGTVVDFAGNTMTSPTTVTVS